MNICGPMEPIHDAIPMKMGRNWVNICGQMEPIRDAIPMKIMRETISKRYGVLERRKNYKVRFGDGP